MRLRVHVPSKSLVLISLPTLARDELNRSAALAEEYREMKYFAPPTPLVLHSDFSPDECERRLRESIDPERPKMFGFSGYRGSQPFLAQSPHLKWLATRKIVSRIFVNKIPIEAFGESVDHLRSRKGRFFRNRVHHARPNSPRNSSRRRATYSSPHPSSTAFLCQNAS